MLTVTYGGRVRIVYRHALNGFSFEAPEGVARVMSVDPAVAWVEQVVPGGIADTQYDPPSWGLDRVDQRAGLDSTYVYDQTGAGVNVYIIDTGIRPTHQDFGGRASIVFDNVGDGGNGNDCNGHGTHVAGTAAGAAFA